MLIKNIKIINYNKTINNADLEIKNDKIVSIIKKDGIAKKILIPGFIDTHIHGFANNEVMKGKENIRNIARNLLDFGITSWMPTVMTEQWEKIIETFKDIEEIRTNKEFNGSSIVGIHLEGPFISREKKGAHNEQYIIKPQVSHFKELRSSFNNSLPIKCTIAPEILDKEDYSVMKELNFIPSIGHSNLDGNVSRILNEFKITSATHLWNAMSGVKNRKPGIVEYVLNNDNVYAELICDLIHVDSETLKLSIKAKGSEKIIAVTDALSAAGAPDGKYTSGGIPIIKKGNLITLEDGKTIAGSATNMYDNFKNLVELGFNLNDVVSMTSYNATKNMLFENIGQIKEGYFADFIILDENLLIEKVVSRGKVV